MSRGSLGLGATGDGAKEWNSDQFGILGYVYVHVHVLYVPGLGSVEYTEYVLY